MGKELTFYELTELRSMAIQESNAIPPHARLERMERDLTVSEQAAVAWYNAVLSMLNNKGAIKDGWINPVEPAVKLEAPDNGLVLDGVQAFDLSTVQKKKLPRP